VWNSTTFYDPKQPTHHRSNKNISPNFETQKQCYKIQVTKSNANKLLKDKLKQQIRCNCNRYIEQNIRNTGFFFYFHRRIYQNVYVTILCNWRRTKQSKQIDVKTKEKKKNILQKKKK
jgi:hypothetical protein